MRLVLWQWVAATLHASPEIPLREEREERGEREGRILEGKGERMEDKAKNNPQKYTHGKRNCLQVRINIGRKQTFTFILLSISTSRFT